MIIIYLNLDCKCCTIMAGTHPLQVFHGTFSGSSIDCQFHLWYLLVNLLHEVNNKVNKFVFEHLLCVEVCDEEGDIITLQQKKLLEQTLNCPLNYCIWLDLYIHSIYHANILFFLTVPLLFLTQFLSFL